MKRIRWIGLTALAICALLCPQDTGAQGLQRRVSTTVLPVLKIDHGARMAGMGGAYVAIADDIDAIFSNVAGLTHIERVAFSVGYSRWLLKDHFYTGGFAYSTRHGVVGLSVMAFRPKPFEETTIFQPRGTGRTPDMGDISIGAAYAKRFTDKLSFGFLARWTQETLDQDRLSTFDVSLSTLFYTGFKSMRLGMAFENLGKDVKVFEQAFKMPVSFSFAAAMEMFGKKGDKAYLTVTGENYYATDFADVQYRLGAEMWFQNTLALRGGYKINFDGESYSLGVGVKFKPVKGKELRADFAYSDFGRFFDAPLRFTLGGSF